MSKVISRDFSKTPEISEDPMDWICPIKPLRHNKLKERPFLGEIYRWKDEKGAILLTDDTFRCLNGVPTGQKKSRSRKEL